MATKKSSGRATGGKSFTNTRGKTFKQRSAGGKARGYGKMRSAAGRRVGRMGRHEYKGTSHEPVK